MECGVVGGDGGSGRLLDRPGRLWTEKWMVRFGNLLLGHFRLVVLEDGLPAPYEGPVIVV